MNLRKLVANNTCKTIKDIESKKPVFHGRSRFGLVIIKGNAIVLTVKRIMILKKYANNPCWVAEIKTKNWLIALKRKIFNKSCCINYSNQPTKFDLYYKKEYLATIEPTCFLVKWFPYIYDNTKKLMVNKDSTKDLGCYDTSEEAKTIVENYLELWK